MGSNPILFRRSSSVPQLSVLIPGILVALLFLYIVRSYWPQKRAPKHLEIYQAGYKSYDAPGGEQYLIHVHKSDATPALRKAIAVGAVLSEQNGFPTNRIETGRPVEQMREWLAGAWGVTDTIGAKQEIQHLFDAGHRVVLDRVAELGQTLSAPELSAALIHEFPNRSIDDLREFAENFSATGPTLVPPGRLGSPEELPMFGTIAYDIGRAVTVARVAAAAGFLTIAEAEAYCHDALQIAENTFPTWSSFATSYLAARALWGGVDDPNFSVMHDMARMLL